MEPASLLAEALGDGVDERGGVVVERRLDLGDALGRRGGRVRGERRGGVGRHDPELGPGGGRRQLDLEPGRELALVRPDAGHGRAGVAGDHLPQCRAGAGQARRMRSASAAALLALSTPTVATGTPGGIWAIASSASRPSRTLRLERSGTPITGRSVCAATAPGQRRGEAGAADEDAEPALAGAARVLGDRVGRPVGGADLELVADAGLVENGERALHPLAVGLGADEDADLELGLSHGGGGRRCRSGSARRGTLCGRPPRRRGYAPRRSSRRARSR